MRMILSQVQRWIKSSRGLLLSARIIPLAWILLGVSMVSSLLIVDPLIRRAEAEGACWTGVPVLEVQNLSGISYGLALEVFSA